MPLARVTATEDLRWSVHTVFPCETPEAYKGDSGLTAQGPRWVLPATILGSSMSFIDGSVVNIASAGHAKQPRVQLRNAAVGRQRLHG